MTPSPPQLRGIAALLFAALLWGVGFYAQRKSIEHITPLWATAQRFVMAAPIALVVILHRRRAGVTMPTRAGLWLGALLYAAFILQTVALAHTSMARVALLTGLYGVFVPLLQPWFGLARPKPMQWAAAALGCLGVLLLCGISFDGAMGAAFNVGDGLTLMMAVISAVYVLVAGRVMKHADALALNALQVLVMAGLAVVVAVVLDAGGVAVDTSGDGLVAFVYLAVFSTFVAFACQFYGQRTVSPATASILMLMETPVGVVAALLLLGEVMTPLQWVGAALMMTAVVLAVRAETNE
jgi:drug/metabolite transporter (DMT)-like permease